MRKDVENWRKQAQRDLRVAHKLFKVKEYYAVAFFCQQAVEKALKAVYILKHNRLIKVHDLVRLARELQAPEEVILSCAAITPVYVEVRYPESDELPAHKVDSSKAKDLLRLSKEVLRWVQQNL